MKNNKFFSTFIRRFYRLQYTIHRTRFIYVVSSRFSAGRKPFYCCEHVPRSQISCSSKEERREEKRKNQNQ